MFEKIKNIYIFLCSTRRRLRILKCLIHPRKWLIKMHEVGRGKPFFEKLKDKHITRQTLKSVAMSKVILASWDHDHTLIIGATFDIYSAPINIG